MSALVAYQSQLQRVTPLVAVTPVRRDDEPAPATTSATDSAISTGGDPAAGPLLALLGRTGLSGPDGTVVADRTATAPTGARQKLQQALSTLHEALNPRGVRPGTAASQDGTPAVDDAIRTILGALASAPAATTSSAAAATVNTDASGQAVAAPAPKPNLDALNRVLAHYTAQSAAASTVVTLVR